MSYTCSLFLCRSSYTCSYFVLPCCQHDFNRRYSGKVKGKSQYQSYLAYVAQVGRACGFEVEEDTLRIPSTKRVSACWAAGSSPRVPASSDGLTDSRHF